MAHRTKTETRHRMICNHYGEATCTPACSKATAERWVREGWCDLNFEEYCPMAAQLPDSGIRPGMDLPESPESASR